jgi:hypothetical protein
MSKERSRFNERKDGGNDLIMLEETSMYEVIEKRRLFSQSSGGNITSLHEERFKVPDVSQL